MDNFQIRITDGQLSIKLTANQIESVYSQGYILGWERCLWSYRLAPLENVP